MNILLCIYNINKIINNNNYYYYYYYYFEKNLRIFHKLLLKTFYNMYK